MSCINNLWIFGTIKYNFYRYDHTLDENTKRYSKLCNKRKKSHINVCKFGCLFCLFPLWVFFFFGSNMYVLIATGGKANNSQLIDSQ